MADLVFKVPHNLSTIDKSIPYILGLTDVGYGNIAGILLLVLIFSVLFLTMKFFGSDKSFAVSSLSIGVIGILLRTMNLINDITLTVCIAFIIYGLYLLKKSSALYEQ